MSNLSVKLFVGCLISPEIRHLLRDSSAWKEKSIAWQSESNGLKEIRYENHEYFGKYIESKEVPLPKIKEIEQEIRAILDMHCPEVPTNKIKIVVFSHLFVA